MISRLKDTLLLVVEEAEERSALREIFGDSYNLLEAENLLQAELFLKQNNDCIAAVLVDLKEMDDDDVCAVNCAAGMGSDMEIPIISLISPTGTGSREEQAFARGASDVVFKPYTPLSIRRRVQVLVDLHLHKWHLQNQVKEQRETIRNTNQVMLDALSAIIEHRNTESGNHVLRIRRFTKILLEDVAEHFPEYNLTPNSIDIISGAAALHDIGKISIPDSILNKPGRLSDEEYDVIKSHTTVGGQLIQRLSGMGDTEYLRYAYNIAMYHHERWDGRGYPKGLAGDEIPICAQVVGIADAYDALTTQRAYKEAYSCELATNMIMNNECGVFSPKVLECFKHVRVQFAELARLYADGYSPKDDAITMPLPGPEWKNTPMNLSQRSIIKYQALLHYLNDTVIEMDLDSGVYHIVYNPDPVLDSIIPSASLLESKNLLESFTIHPDDLAITDEIKDFIPKKFFELNLRRKTYSFRILSPEENDYHRYELNFLRINTEDVSNRVVTMVWHRADRERTEAASGWSELGSPFALKGLTGSALRCLMDEELSIEGGLGNLYGLTAYTEEEIRKEFGGKFMNMVEEGDRAAFAEAVAEHLKAGGRSEYELRIKRKGRESLWVLARSRLYVEAGGRERLYFVLHDISRGKALEHELRAAIERNQIIVDQSGGIVFEWDMLSDTMYCSPRWQERFGYVPISKNYGSQMGIATHFHPDDLVLVRSAVEEIRSHGSSISIDVRIADAKARYLWTRINATAYMDAGGNVSRIVGILQDIDMLKRAEMALRERAEYDSLTKLLNKVSAQQMVSEYLEKEETGGLSAMLIMDLDNFKAVNDNYGHLYGDSVLAQVGAGLKRMFRSRDIIGRIGGDEFLIFMSDIPNVELVHSRCGQILDTFQEKFEELCPGMNVSCSIGVALVPDHGRGYNELFMRSDKALYQSKSRGKNCYTIYDSGMLSESPAAFSHVAARIDSEEIPGLADASFVRFVFNRLYESTDIEATFNEILAYVGIQLNVSRVYIFENSEDNSTCSNTFEWCNEGIAPEKDYLQNVSYIEDIAGWPEVFNEQGVFYCTDISSLAPHFRAILEPQGIKSMLQCAIMDNGVFSGYVGFDECSVNRLWTKDQIELLQFLAEVLAMFLLKKRAQDKMVEQADNLRRILDRQDIWLYVIDPDSCQIKFMNKKALDSVGDGAALTCYKALRGRESRCENCPAENIRQEKNRSVLIDDICFGCRVQANASEIQWNGESACLVFCYEQDN